MYVALHNLAGIAAHRQRDDIMHAAAAYHSMRACYAAAVRCVMQRFLLPFILRKKAEAMELIIDNQRFIEDAAESWKDFYAAPFEA